MSGFLKMMWMSTLPPWDFSRKIHRIFPSINHRQFVNTQPTHQPCLCLTGWLSGPKPAGHVWPRLTYKENRPFHWAKGHSLWPSPPPPPGDNAWRPSMVAAASQCSGLSAPTLLDGTPPAFSSTARASLPAIAGRQAKKFCAKLDTVSKIQTYILFWYTIKLSELIMIRRTLCLSFRRINILNQWLKRLRFFGVHLITCN